MAKIKAVGKRDGAELEITVDNGVTYINGVKEDIFDAAIYAQYPMAGTYYPEPDSMENALNTLSYHFFDDPPEIETEGSFEDIPYVEGRIY